MKLTKTVAVPLVGVLLVIGAGAVLATTAMGPSSGAVPVQPAAESPSPAPTAGTKAKLDVQDTALTDALDKLVAKGTINVAQKQAVLDAVAAERIARQQARQAVRQKAMADWQQLRGFLADGVITKDEFDKLPADSPLRTMTTLMADGKITLDELKAAGRGLFGAGLGKGWMKHGMGGMGKWGDGADATPAPTTGSGG
jgi:hypothetical protein